MKRFVSFLLQLLIIATMFSVISVSATEGEFTQAQAKALVDAADASRATLQNYYGNHMLYVQGEHVKGNFVESKEKRIQLPDSSSTQLYMTLFEHLLPGGSYDEFIKGSYSIFTDDIADIFCNKCYADNNYSLFIKEEGMEYIIAPSYLITQGYMYSPQDGIVELIEVSSDSATAKVYCKKDGYSELPISVECKFEKTADGWRICDSDFADMMTSHDGFKYTVETAPSTGDENGVRIWWLAGVSIAAIVPAVCLLRRRRRED